MGRIEYVLGDADCPKWAADRLMLFYKHFVGLCFDFYFSLSREPVELMPGDVVWLDGEQYGYTRKSRGMYV